LWDVLFVVAFIVLPAVIVGWSLVLLCSVPSRQRTSTLVGVDGSSRSDPTGSTRPQVQMNLT
jgi:hypothetical protein